MSRIDQTIQELRNASLQVQVIVGVMVLVGLFALYTTARTLVDGYHITQETKQLEAKIKVSNQQAVGLDLKKIVGAPIFGEAQVQQTERVNTTLNLLGVMASGDNTVRRAFIAEPREDALVYYEGNEISKGLVVHKIEQDRVTLRRFGVSETLYITWDQIEGVSKSKARSTSKAKNPTRKAIPRRSSSVARQTPEERAAYLKKIRERYKGGTSNMMGGKSYKEFIDEGGTREEYMQKIRERFKNIRGKGGRGGYGGFGPGLGGRPGF